MADPTTKYKFLIDTGADISVIPKSPNTYLSKPEKLVLFAANGTPIPTYGTKLLTLNFNLKRSFSWPFVIADVTQPIIGIDFLTKFNLLVDVKNNRLIDGVTQLESPGCRQNRPTTVTNITAVTNDSPYHRILAEFTTITNPSITPKTKKTPTTFHHIETKGPPVFSKPRWLPPDTLRAARKEF
ncbi:uncharacterized protein [Centruroides vittatus]|uniref:uncharacterized protein n=1 Tax=Centruroides vittatus TaxID=120091 RepID=UPI00350EE28B